jgi:multicomponent Na+:H+ antiporter subunit F
MTISDFALRVIIPMLMLSGALATYRAIVGPSLADRVVALDLLTAVAIGLIAAYAMAVNKPVFLDVALTVGLITFLGTIAFARYIERSL